MWTCRRRSRPSERALRPRRPRSRRDRRPGSPGNVWRRLPCAEPVPNRPSCFSPGNCVRGSRRPRLLPHQVGRPRRPVLRADRRRRSAGRGTSQPTGTVGRRPTPWHAGAMRSPAPPQDQVVRGSSFPPPFRRRRRCHLRATSDGPTPRASPRCCAHCRGGALRGRHRRPRQPRSGRPTAAAWSAARASRSRRSRCPGRRSRR